MLSKRRLLSFRITEQTKQFYGNGLPIWATLTAGAEPHGLLNEKMTVINRFAHYIDMSLNLVTMLWISKVSKR